MKEIIDLAKKTGKRAEGRVNKLCLLPYLIKIRQFVGIRMAHFGILCPYFDNLCYDILLIEKIVVKLPLLDEVRVGHTKWESRRKSNG